MTNVLHDDQDHVAQPVLGSRLTGWKDVAAYLGRSVRTVQRWEREFSLPVRRMGTDRFESVFAFTGEIDAWLATSSAASARGLDPTPSDSEPPPADAVSDTTVGGAAIVTEQAVLALVPPRVVHRQHRLLWIMAGAFLVLVAVLVAMTGWRNVRLRAPGAEGLAAAGLAAEALATYSLDEGTGVVLLDAGQTHAHGSVTNAAWAEGRMGKGLDFSPGFRTGQHMTAVFPGAFPFHAPGTDASLSFWMRLVDGTHRTLFWTRGDAHSPDTNRFHIYSGGAQRVYGPAIGVDYQSPRGVFHPLFEVPVSLERWVHVALVRAGTRHYTLYLDGEPVATRDDAKPELPTYSADWALWRTQDNLYPKQNGMLDEVALFNRALSAQEVRARFQGRLHTAYRDGQR